MPDVRRLFGYAAVAALLGAGVSGCKSRQATASATKDELLKTSSGNFYLFYPSTVADRSMVCEVYCDKKLGDAIVAGAIPVGAATGGAPAYCRSTPVCVEQSIFISAWRTQLSGTSSYSEADFQTISKRVTSGDADVASALNDSSTSLRLLLSALPLIFQTEADQSSAPPLFTDKDESNLVVRLSRFYRASQEMLTTSDLNAAVTQTDSAKAKAQDVVLLKSRIDQVNDVAAQGSSTTPTQACSSLYDATSCIAAQEQYGCAWQRLNSGPFAYLGSSRCVSVRGSTCHDFDGFYHLCSMSVSADGTPCSFKAQVPPAAPASLTPQAVGACAATNGT